VINQWTRDDSSSQQSLCDTLAGAQAVKDEAGKDDWQQRVASRLESTITQLLCTVTNDRQLCHTERQLLELTC